jgi:hypothetical protein
LGFAVWIRYFYGLLKIAPNSEIVKYDFIGGFLLFDYDSNMVCLLTEKG